MNEIVKERALLENEQERMMQSRRRHPNSSNAVGNRDFTPSNSHLENRESHPLVDVIGISPQQHQQGSTASSPLSFGDVYRSPGSAPELHYSRNQANGVKPKEVLQPRRTEQSARSNVDMRCTNLGEIPFRDNSTTALRQGESSSHFRQFASPSPIRNGHSSTGRQRLSGGRVYHQSFNRSRTSHLAGGRHQHRQQPVLGPVSNRDARPITIEDERTQPPKSPSGNDSGMACVQLEQRTFSRDLVQRQSRASDSTSSANHSQDQHGIDDVFGDSCTLSQPSIHQWYSLSPRTPSMKDQQTPPSSSESNHSPSYSRESTSNGSRKSTSNTAGGPPRTASDDPTMFYKREFSREASTADTMESAKVNASAELSSPLQQSYTTESLPRPDTNGRFMSPGPINSPNGNLSQADRQADGEQHLRTRSRSAKVRREDSNMEKRAALAQSRKAASARPRRSWLTFSQRPPTRQRNMVPNSMDDLNNLTQSFENTTSRRAQAIWKELAKYREAVSDNSNPGASTYQATAQSSNTAVLTYAARHGSSLNGVFEVPSVIREEESGDENSEAEQKTGRMSRSSAKEHSPTKSETKEPTSYSRHFETYDCPAERDGFVHMPVTYDVPINISYTKKSRIQSAAARANIKSKPNLGEKAPQQKRPENISKPNRGSSARLRNGAHPRLRQTTSARPRQQQYSSNSGNLTTPSGNKVSLNNLSIDEAYAAGVQSASALADELSNSKIRDGEADPRPSTEEKPAEESMEVHQQNGDFLKSSERGVSSRRSKRRPAKNCSSDTTQQEDFQEDHVSPRSSARRGDALQEVQAEMLEWERQMMIKRGSDNADRGGGAVGELQSRIDFDDIFVESSDGEDDDASSGEWSTGQDEWENEEDVSPSEEYDDGSLANQIGSALSDDFLFLFGGEASEEDEEQ